MSAEEFWHGDPRLAVAYRDAEQIRRDNRDTNQWLQGRYVYEALLAASPAFREISKGINHPYPPKPLMFDETAGMTEEEKQKLVMDKNKAAFTEMMVRWNKKFEEERAEEADG